MSLLSPVATAGHILKVSFMDIAILDMSRDNISLRVSQSLIPTCEDARYLNTGRLGTAIANPLNLFRMRKRRSI